MNLDITHVLHSAYSCYTVGWILAMATLHTNAARKYMECSQSYNPPCIMYIHSCAQVLYLLDTCVQQVILVECRMYIVGIRSDFANLELNRCYLGKMFGHVL